MTRDPTTDASTLPTASALHARLAACMQPVHLEVIDESYQHAGHAGANAAGVGTHFRVRITSPLFTGVSRVRRHRLVYDALREFIDQGLHALAIEAQEPPAPPSPSLTP